MLLVDICKALLNLVIYGVFFRLTSTINVYFGGRTKLYFSDLFSMIVFFWNWQVYGIIRITSLMIWISQQFGWLF